VHRAYFSARLSADLDRVWAVVGDFHGVAKWVWAVDTCVARGGRASHEVGAIREYTMRDGLTQRERLVAYDAAGHSYTYEFVGTIPFGMSCYQGTVHMSPIVEDGSTFVEWIGDFDAESDIRDTVKSRFERLFAAVTGDLRYHLAGY
jgi:NADPH:quinone reductase